MKPKSIKRLNPLFLKIVWEEGREQVLSIQQLRDHCPCAGCSGETVILHEYKAPEPDRNTPGRYELKSIVPVGSYALQFVWGDGHNTGIHTFERLYGEKS